MFVHECDRGQYHQIALVIGRFVYARNMRSMELLRQPAQVGASRVCASGAQAPQRLERRRHFSDAHVYCTGSGPLQAVQLLDTNMLRADSQRQTGHVCGPCTCDAQPRQ